MKYHVPVLVNEIVSLAASPTITSVLDLTVGAGGHLAALCAARADQKLYGIDVNQSAIARASERLQSCQVILAQANFRDIDAQAAKWSQTGFDLIYADLGWSTHQLQDVPGLSFQNLDDPLDMRFDSSQSLTAADLLQTLDADQLATIFFKYGNETRAQLVARAIVTNRSGITDWTVGDLVEIIESTIRRTGKLHPATKVFQALRIAVNDEFEVLQTGLEKAFQLLRPGGTLAVISFHSAEDRIVKHYFTSLRNQEIATTITKKPLVPQPDELKINPRARSAKLRAITKNPHHENSNSHLQ